MKKNILDIASSTVLGLGFVSLLSPIFFAWWIHGSYERYVWIINGPYPYSHFGGGPYQLVYFLIIPVLLGAGLVILGIILRRTFAKTHEQNTNM